jgi:hypothetical protein
MVAALINPIFNCNKTLVVNKDYAYLQMYIFIAIIQLPDDITFDEFNAQHDGMTRQEYADYADKYLRKK